VIKSKSSFWLVFFLVLIFAVLGFIIGALAYFYNGSMDSFSSAGVAIISINGPIMESESSFSRPSVKSSVLAKYIKEADGDPWVKAIILKIDSPGGTLVPSKSIADAVSKAKKPVISVIRSVGASGAYMVAASSDYIIADELSSVGSIGVIGSYLEFDGFLESYNISYRRLVSGEHKDMGVPFRELTEKEEELLQNDINFVHDYFVERVAFDRKMEISDVKRAADGRVFFGRRALELGLIDQLGDLETAEEKLKKDLKQDKLSYREYRKEPSFLDLMLNAISSKPIDLSTNYNSLQMR
jgi:protease IV